MRLITEKPSEKEIYIWNILGSLANAGLSVIILMVVTRTLDNQKADIFSIAWAISQLMATIGCYQIRVLQATDVEEKFTFRQYFEFRRRSLRKMYRNRGMVIRIKEQVSRLLSPESIKYP